MKQAARCAAAAWVVLGMGLLAGPGSGAAQGIHNGHAGSPATGRGFVAAPVPPRPPGPLRPPGPGNPRTLKQRPFGHRPYKHRRSMPAVVGVPVYVPSPVPVGIPDQYVWTYTYDPAMFYVVPPASEAPEPPEPIEYPTGRYELRGDGVTTPYQWVWVPNPPPEAPAPPPAPPAGPPETTATPVPPAPPPPPVDVYRFTDEQGVVTWTDRWDSIPERYRGQAERLPL
jgi:hypothetical protein